MATATDSIDRRQFPRFMLEPMYAGVSVQRANGMKLASLEGHAYDISEGGVRIELDEPLTPGERVSLCLELPGEMAGIFASARVVRVYDEVDDPGARRSALVFIRFLADEDKARLLRHLGQGFQRRAA